MSRPAKPIEISVNVTALNARAMARIAGQVQKPLLQRLVDEIRTGNATAFSLTADGLTFTCPPAEGAFKIEA